MRLLLIAMMALSISAQGQQVIYTSDSNRYKLYLDSMVMRESAISVAKNKGIIWCNKFKKCKTEKELQAQTKIWLKDTIKWGINYAGERIFCRCTTNTNGKIVITQFKELTNFLMPIRVLLTPPQKINIIHEHFIYDRAKRALVLNNNY